MYVYFHFQEGRPIAAAFHKADRAAEYVAAKIEEYIGVRPKKPAPKKVKAKPSPYRLYADDHHLVVEDQDVPPPMPRQNRFVQVVAPPPQAIPVEIDPMPRQPVAAPVGWQAIPAQPFGVEPIEVPGQMNVDGGNYAAIPAIPAPPPQQPIYADPNIMEALEQMRNRVYGGFENFTFTTQPYTEPPKENTPELIAIRDQITITHNNKTIENAKKLIDQYDAYMRSFGIDCPLHTIQEVKVADERV